LSTGRQEGKTFTMRGFDEFEDIVHYIEKSTYQIWDQKNIGLIYRYYTPSTVVHTSDGDVFGRDAVVENSIIKMAAFPDTRDLIEDVVYTGSDQDGYRTSMRWTWTAHNTGHSVYGPPTGRRVVVSGIANCFVRGENVVEEWVVYNELSLLRQLGLDAHEVLRDLSENDDQRWPPESTGEVERLPGQAPPPELPPAEHDGFDVEDFVRRAFHEVWNRRMFGRIPEYYAPDFLCHGASDRELRGPDEFTKEILAMLAMFPDAAVYVDDLYWNDDGEGRYRTAVLWTLLGTHTGPGVHGPPTGRRVRVMGITQHRITNGRFVEEWTEYGEFDLMKQLLLPMRDEPPESDALEAIEG
jgi:predicted ester cyclase